MYNLDSPPVSRGMGHGLHDGGERASAEPIRHIVVCVDAGELQRRKVSVHVSSLQERSVVAWESRTRFHSHRAGYATVLENARSVDLCMSH